MGLSFDPVEHRYYWGTREVPSVTTILKNGAASFAPDASRKRGTMAHAITAMMDHWTIGLEDVPDDYRGFAVAWQAFKDKELFVPSEIEVPGIDAEKRYAGTIDRIGTVGDRGRWVLDIKTGLRNAWHDLQVAGYQGLSGKGLKKWTGAGSKLGLVYIKANGTYRFWEVQDVKGSAVRFRAKLIEYEKGHPSGSRGK
jgi:hypothetical protein